MLAPRPISNYVYFIDLSFLPSLLKLNLAFYFSHAILTY